MYNYKGNIIKEVSKEVKKNRTETKDPVYTPIVNMTQFL